MENLTDPTMEFINRDACTSLGYQCFAKGFHDQDEADTDTRSNEQNIEVNGWNLELFQHGENNEWVVWFWDAEDDEDYFGEFWLIFAEEKRAVAEHAYKLLGDFLHENIKNIGKIPPSILDGKLYEIVDEI